MLIDVSIENFRSIKEEQTLSMLATNSVDLEENTYTYKKLKILKSAVLYGANASGKSNVLKSIQALKDFVLNSTDIKVGERIKYYDPYKLDKSYIDQPTSLEIEFLNIDNIRYRYGFRFDSLEIKEEYLYYYPIGRERKLFERKKGKKISYGDDLEGDKKIIERQLLINNLFLSKAANSNNVQLKMVYDYFNHLFFASDFVEAIESLDAIPDLRLSEIPEDFINAFIKVADLGIDSVEYKFDETVYERLKKSHPSLNDNDLKEMATFPQMLHNVYNGDKLIEKISFEMHQESKGTRKLYILIPMLYPVLKYNSTLFIDEFDDSLHPYITHYLLSMFRSKKFKNQACQLIFATHDVSFLGLSVLRKDQIWFTEKTSFGSTHLYSLSEFKNKDLRKNTPLDKWYMSGRFGALPLLGELNDLLSDGTKKS